MPAWIYDTDSGAVSWRTFLHGSSYHHGTCKWLGNTTRVAHWACELLPGTLLLDDNRMLRRISSPLWFCDFLLLGGMLIICWKRNSRWHIFSGWGMVRCVCTKSTKNVLARLTLPWQQQTHMDEESTISDTWLLINATLPKILDEILHNVALKAGSEVRWVHGLETRDL